MTHFFSHQNAPEKRKKHTFYARGFSLVEVAIALLILGTISAGVLSLFNMWQAKLYMQQTEERQERIFKALGVFLKKNGRLPCPADPMDKKHFGHARRSCSAMKCQGIVPFQTLGLPESTAQNGAHVFFTYVVHPDMTKKPRLPKNNRTLYCGHKPRILIEILPHGPKDRLYAKDPIVVVLLNHLRTGEGSFLKGYRRRKSYLNPTRFQRQNIDSDFIFHDPRRVPYKTEETLRFETKDNLASFYAHVVCAPEQ